VKKQTYRVGYRQPPKATRFKSGETGNPKGRPAGSRNLASDLSAELSERVSVREGGQTQRLTKQRALIKSLMAKALQGDVRATSAILGLYARVIGETSGDEGPLDEADLMILKKFGARIFKTTARKGTK
jgi:hypothetical protein